MYESESLAPLGSPFPHRSPTAYAVGCILAPLRGSPRMPEMPIHNESFMRVCEPLS